MDDQKILISIVNWKCVKDTIAIIKQLLDTGIGISNIFVADNASDDGSIQKLQETYPGIKIIASKHNGGFAAGHKLAAENAIKKNYELLWIINPDIILNGNSLTALTEAYLRKGPGIYGSVSVSKEKPDIVEFGGAYEISENISGELQTEVGLRCFDRSASSRHGTQADNMMWENKYDIYTNHLLSDLQRKYKEYEVGAVEGFSMFIPLEIIKKHGFMDTCYFMYGEETEYCLRLRKKGVRCYMVPDSVVVHKGEGAFQGKGKKNPVVTYYRARNFRLMAKKHFGLKTRDITKDAGGLLPLTWYILKNLLKGKNKSSEYYHYLGVLHSAWNLKGKRIKPERYL